MKISFSSREQGKVILLCLFTMIAVGVVLASYLSLGSNHQVLSTRSQVWNIALPVAEAGLEEGITQLNWTLGLGLDTNGWTMISGNKGKGGNGTYTKTRQLTADSYYKVSIYENNKQPTVTSIGYARAPLSTNYISRIKIYAIRTTFQYFCKGPIHISKVALAHLNAIYFTGHF